MRQLDGAGFVDPLVHPAAIHVASTLINYNYIPAVGPAQHNALNTSAGSQPTCVLD